MQILPIVIVNLSKFMKIYQISTTNSNCLFSQLFLNLLFSIISKATYVSNTYITVFLHDLRKKVTDYPKEVLNIHLVTDCLALL